MSIGRRRMSASALPLESPIRRSRPAIAKCPANGTKWLRGSRQSMKRWLNGVSRGIVVPESSNGTSDPGNAQQTSSGTVISRSASEYRQIDIISEHCVPSACPGRDRRSCGKNLSEVR
jgi:hypothetical protein